MKTCPRCRRSYEDDTLVFCLDDGSRLVGAPDRPDANATWHLPQTPLPTEVSPTIMPSRPTVPSPQPTITARPDQYQYRHQVEEGTSKRNPLPWILAIVLVLGISAVAIAYILTRGGATTVVTKTPTPDPRVTPIVPTPEPTQSPRSSPEPTVDTPKKEVTPKPTPPPQRPKPAFSLMNNISYSGGSRITYYPRASVGLCQADCAANARCRAFTWIRPGAYNPGDSAMCYIMASVSGPVSHPCCISGVKN